MPVSGQLLCYASGPAREVCQPCHCHAHPAAQHYPGSQDPMLGPCTSTSEAGLGETSPQEAGGAANYFRPRNGLRDVLESNEDILSPVKGMDLWDLQLLLVTC